MGVKFFSKYLPLVYALWHPMSTCRSGSPETATTSECPRGHQHEYHLAMRLAFMFVVIASTQLFVIALYQAFGVNATNIMLTDSDMLKKL